MGFVDKAKAKVEEAVGEFKESVGEAYGNEALELDGEAEAAAAREREAADRVSGPDRGAEPAAADATADPGRPADDPGPRSAGTGAAP